jgi:nucleoside-diphosphate-sugar epimerase
MSQSAIQYSTAMRVLVTGGRGKVGRAAVPALQRAGHEVTVTDLLDPDWDRPPAGTPPYVKADLTDAGQVYALIGGASAGEGPRPGPFDAVVHAGALPAPGRHAPHVVFGNNLMGVFNVVEACVRWGVRRLVNISSETVPGFIFAERPFEPEYVPVDEEHPVRPQDPYALAKLFGEQLCDAAVQRSDLRCVSLRPSWVQDARSYPGNLGPLLADRTMPSINGWAYIDADDLADAIRLAVESDLPGHEVFYIAGADTIGGRRLREDWPAVFPGSTTELREVPRPDAPGISTAKAERLLGWRATRSWRDHLTEDGKPLA